MQLGTGSLSTVKVARQPILSAGPGHPVVGYELLFSDSGSLFGAFADVDDFRATSEVLSHSVLTLGVDAVVGDAQAFVRFPRAQIVDGTPLMLPPTQSAIELGRDAWAGRDVTGIVERCRSYQERGYEIVLSDYFPTTSSAPLLEVADFVKIDLNGRTPEQIAEAVAPLTAAGTRVVALGVDTEEHLADVLAAGVDLLQGYFFSSPTVVEGRELPGFKLAYLHLLRKAYAPDVDFADLAAAVKTDVALTYKLLRYVNSAYFGLRGRIESVERALVMLGLSHVQRWVSVATVSGLSDPRPQELAVLCATRARFCESLGEQLAVADDHDCFTLGMFSLLDVMLGKPMETALADIPVSDGVRGALLGKPGVLTDLLDITVAYERGRWEVVARLAEANGWDEADLIRVYIDAIEWSRDFFGGATS